MAIDPALPRDTSKTEHNKQDQAWMYGKRMLANLKVVEHDPARAHDPCIIALSTPRLTGLTRTSLHMADPQSDPNRHVKLP